jgi:primosomal protein N' (replication factor Y)
MFVEVAVNLAGIRGSFHYHLPPELEGAIGLGHLVIVPFGHRRVQGVVTGLPAEAEVPETRPVESLVDPQPVVSPAQLQLARWLAAETLTPLIDCLTLMLPPGLGQEADSLYTLLDPQASSDNPTQSHLLRLLAERGPLRGRQIAQALSRANWRRATDVLARRGAIRRESILTPTRARAKRVRSLRLAVPPQAVAEAALGSSSHAAAARRRKVLEALARETHPLEAQWLYAETGANSADLRWLEGHGLVLFEEEESWRDPLADMAFVPSEAPTLTLDQAAAWEPIRAALHAPSDVSPPAFLLHGVTGSGKTEIYLRAVAETLAIGQGAIVLVPEIALTPQTARRFLARFPGRLGLLHSQLSMGQRYDTWRRCRDGLLPVVLGPRSALFAPLPHIALIILDEEHDDSYKEQGQAPRYHARSAALAYARMLSAVCVLGSATPDIGTFHHAERGDLVRLTLPQRILGHRQRLQQLEAQVGAPSRFRPTGTEAAYAELPAVRVVDMRQELRSGNTGLFSRPLRQALQETLDAGQQAILFLNRRGAATYFFCRDCGWAAHCPRCSTSLTLHPARERLVCHRCGLTRRIPLTCPSCGSRRVRQFGAGTQRVEAEVSREFPGARTLRWDWDVTRTRGAHDVILSHFSAHRADVLIGTQMIAKSLDLPLVTLVGVVSADTGLHLPDFRAAERTFQVLTQVAGRAGRSILGGRVILQTYEPDHYAVRAAAAHDYPAFYQQEVRHRRELGYPPFCRLARLVYHHANAVEAQRQAERLARLIRRRVTQAEASADLIGPAPCFFERVRGEYRWQVVVRASDPREFVPETLPEGWVVDVDPVSLL